MSACATASSAPYRMPITASVSTIGASRWDASGNSGRQ